MHGEGALAGSGMVYLSKRYCKFILLLIGAVFLGGCTELGDIVVISYSIKSGTVKLADFDGDFIPKETLGASPNCLARRSSIDSNKWMGICVNSDNQKIIVYRAFSNDFKIQENGITKKVLESKDFEEMNKISVGVDAVLNKNKTIFEKENPKYVPFKVLNEEYQFTR